MISTLSCRHHWTGGRRRCAERRKKTEGGWQEAQRLLLPAWSCVTGMLCMLCCLSQVKTTPAPS